MSFSRDAKNELSLNIDSARHCRLAELTAITGFFGDYGIMADGRVNLSYESEKVYTIRAVSLLIKKLCHLSPQLSVISGKALGKNRLYVLSLNNSEAVKKLLTEMGFMQGGGLVDLRSSHAFMIPKSDCCRRAFLKGVFISCGSISDPNKNYHLEMACDSPERAADVSSLISGLGVKNKVSERKGRHMVYVKDGESESDILAIMGATKAMLELENIRIIRDITGNVNRKVNCETANLNKAVSAGLEQVRQIELIRDKLGLESLPDDLRKVADLRLEYQDTPIAELGQMLNPPLGKSGIYHRFERIKKIAEEIK